jgi:hypothetical protein
VYVKELIVNIIEIVLHVAFFRHTAFFAAEIDTGRFVDGTVL